MTIGRAHALRQVSVGFLVLAMFGAAGPAYAASERVVYRFKGGSDALQPDEPLMNVGGTLYGTTVGGGGTGCYGAGGCGTLFSVTKAGKEKIVYSFQGGTEGSPQTGLIDVGGTLYGTTPGGGSSTDCSGGCGTVFSVTPAGVKTIVYSFQGDGSDGAAPTGSLINLGGTLYGTTYFGGLGVSGDSGYGTVFAVTTAGVEKVVYAFKSNGGADGRNPSSGLINLGGTLYGTTGYGGGNNNEFGTVFSVTPAGIENVIYSFQGGSDGEYPRAGLINVGGILYGTTFLGGADYCIPGGQPSCGTVFSVTQLGVEKVIHAFQGGSDGANPEAPLTNLGGTLYGTTPYGGGGACAPGCGTVFSVTKAGAENVVYAFRGGKDAANPEAAPVAVGRTLYGTTYAGGGYSFRCHAGCGTVFAVTP